MLVDLILELVGGLIAGLLSSLPPLPLPENVIGTGPGTVSATIAQGASSIYAMDAWIPADQLIAGIAVVTACAAFAFALKMVRIVASLFTGGGGSAA